MKLTRRAFLVLVTLFGLLLPVTTIASPAYAVDIFHNCTSTPGSCTDCTNANNTDVCKEIGNTDNSNPIIHIIKVVIDVVSYIAGAAVVIELIVSGIKLTMSNGDSNAIASARTGILYSLIGVAIIIAAQAIVAFVLNKI